MADCKYPGCTWEGASRPYQYARDGIPSASKIAELLDDGKSEAFGGAAALITATTAVHHPDQWVHLDASGCTEDKYGPCRACRYLRSEYSRRWTHKAERGNHVHHLAVTWAQGDDVESDAETDPYLDSLEAFYSAHHPVWLETERTVLYDVSLSHRYRGQFDGICDLDCPVCPGERCRWLVDFKTGQWHPVSQTLQMAGYRYANNLTSWVPADPQPKGKRKYPKLVERVDGPMPPVAHAGVILLDPELGGRLVEMPANRDAHGTFLRLRDAWAWAQQMKKWAKDNPLAGTGTTEIEGEEAA